MEIGFPTDAARLYDETLADTETLRTGPRTISATTNLSRTGGPPGAGRLAPGGSTARRSRRPGGPRSRARRGRRPPAPDPAAGPRSGHGGEPPGRGDQVGRRRTLQGVLKESGRAWRNRSEGQPRDVPARVALTLAIIANGSPEEAASAVESLAKLVRESPLEGLETGDRANSRQRAEANRQLGLWLVARECARRPVLSEAGKALADRALEAARRQGDPAWSLAMLREAGQDALDRGDRANAEAQWSKMLAPDPGFAHRALNGRLRARKPASRSPRSIGSSGP